MAAMAARVLREKEKKQCRCRELAGPKQLKDSRHQVQASKTWGHTRDDLAPTDPRRRRIFESCSKWLPSLDQP